MFRVTMSTRVTFKAHVSITSTIHQKGIAQFYLQGLGDQFCASLHIWATGLAATMSQAMALKFGACRDTSGYCLAYL